MIDRKAGPKGPAFLWPVPERGGFGNCVVYYNMLYRGFGFFYFDHR